MSTEMAFLSLRLEGPLQAWGFDSQYNRRNTGLFPTLSAMAGMCCAALGVDRGCAEEQIILTDFSNLRMTAIAIPKTVRGKALEIRRLQDYHTVMNTKKADGNLKDCHITQRLYLCDACFAVVLEGGRSFLQHLADGLKDPKWGLWLGRKSCIPSAPVLVGLFDTQAEALKPHIGKIPIDHFARQEEAESFAEGRDSLPDKPLSFLASKRTFAPRRVRTIHGGS